MIIGNFEIPDAARRPIWIWQFSLEVEERSVTPLSMILSPDELLRARRFVNRRDRIQFIVARARLRKVLGEIYQIDPQEITFRYGEYGKPEVVSEVELHFNLAHSGTLGVIATSKKPIGIDLEVYGNYHDLSNHVLTSREIENFRQNPSEEHFLRYWTAKEASLKLWGTGLSLEPTAIEVTCGEPSICRVINSQSSLENAIVVPIEVDSNYACSIAYYK